MQSATLGRYPLLSGPDGSPDQGGWALYSGGWSPGLLRATHVPVLHRRHAAVQHQLRRDRRHVLLLARLRDLLEQHDAGDRARSRAHGAGAKRACRLGRDLLQVGVRLRSLHAFRHASLSSCTEQRQHRRARSTVQDRTAAGARGIWADKERRDEHADRQHFPTTLGNTTISNLAGYFLAGPCGETTAACRARLFLTHIKCLSVCQRWLALFCARRGRGHSLQLCAPASRPFRRHYRHHPLSRAAER